MLRRRQENEGHGLYHQTILEKSEMYELFIHQDKVSNIGMKRKEGIWGRNSWSRLQGEEGIELDPGDG